MCGAVGPEVVCDLSSELVPGRRTPRWRRTSRPRLVDADPTMPVDWRMPRRPHGAADFAAVQVEPRSVWRMTPATCLAPREPPPPRDRLPGQMRARMRTGGRVRRRRVQVEDGARGDLPAAVGIPAVSPAQRRFGAVAVTCLFSGPGNSGAVSSRRVSPLRRLISRATRSWRRIESATVSSDTVRPASRGSSCGHGRVRNRRPTRQQRAGGPVRHAVVAPLVGGGAGHAHLVASVTRTTTDRPEPSRSIRTSASCAQPLQLRDVALEQALGGFWSPPTRFSPLPG